MYNSNWDKYKIEFKDGSCMYIRAINMLDATLSACTIAKKKNKFVTDVIIKEDTPKKGT